MVNSLPIKQQLKKPTLPLEASYRAISSLRKSTVCFCNNKAKYVSMRGIKVKLKQNHKNRKNNEHKICNGCQGCFAYHVNK